MTTSRKLVAGVALLTVVLVGCGQDDSDEPVRDLAPTSTAPAETPPSSGLEDSPDEERDTRGAEPGREGGALDPPGGSDSDTDGDQDDVNPETLRD